MTSRFISTQGLSARRVRRADVLTPTFRDQIALSSESTVVAEFVADPASSANYQSEADLERSLIELFRGQAYEFLPITK